MRIIERQSKDPREIRWHAAWSCDYLRNAMDAVLHDDAVVVGCYIDADPEQDRVFPPLPEG